MTSEQVITPNDILQINSLLKINELLKKKKKIPVVLLVSIRYQTGRKLKAGAIVYSSLKRLFVFLDELEFNLVSPLTKVCINKFIHLRDVLVLKNGPPLALFYNQLSNYL